jgi:hypothetical protein
MVVVPANRRATTPNTSRRKAPEGAHAEARRYHVSDDTHVPDGDDPIDGCEAADTDAVEKGVHAQLVLQGYINAEGGIDWQQMRLKLYPLIYAAQVDKLSERGNKALWLQDAVEALFPSALSTAEEWAQEDDPEVAQEIWKDLMRKVWAQCSPNPTGPLQRMVRETMQMVLVRANVGVITKDPESGKARQHVASLIYATRDMKCLIQDYQGLPQRQAKKAIKKAADYTAHAIHTVPEHGDAFDRDFRKKMKGSLEAGEKLVKGALEAAKEAEALGNDEEDEAA